MARERGVDFKGVEVWPRKARGARGGRRHGCMQFAKAVNKVLPR